MASDDENWLAKMQAVSSQNIASPRGILRDAFKIQKELLTEVPVTLERVFADYGKIDWKNFTPGYPYRHQTGISDKIFSNDGKLVLALGWDGSIRFFENSTGKSLPTWVDPFFPVFDANRVAFSPDDSYIAIYSARTNCLALQWTGRMKIADSELQHTFTYQIGE